MKPAITALLPACLSTFPFMAWGQSACEPQRLVSPPATVPARFGKGVATNGTQWFIADNNARTLPGPSFAGAVHVYDQWDGRLVHRQTLTPPDAELADVFGFSLSVDGNRMLVGSMGTTNPFTGDRAGAGFVYEFDGEEWVEDARLWPVGVVREFGGDVVLCGQAALIRPLTSNDLHTYWKTNDGWVFDGFLRPDGELPRRCFGQAMVAGDGWFFIGAPCETSVPGTDEGAIYVYRQQPDGSLSRTQKIGPGRLLRLGWDLSFDGTTLAVGAPFYSDTFEGQGAVLLFELVNDQWVEVDRITHSRASRVDQFGFSVAIHGDTLVAGVLLEDTPGTDGSAYLFRRDAAGTWREVDRLIPNTPDFAGRYAESVATDGGFALVGAHGDRGPTGDSDGAAYLFDVACYACAPDLDLDGTLTIFDFLTFGNLFDLMDPRADFDGDGELTVFDFLAFQTAFDAGC